MSKKCTRLLSQLATLESLKHYGMTQLELSNMILHLLRLISATVTIETSGTTKTVSLHYENVGYIHDGVSKPASWQDCSSSEVLEDELTRPFALPTPAREALMSVIISIMSKKSPLRSVSNAAIFPEQDETIAEKRFLLIIHWKFFLRMLLRSAPFLDERKWTHPPTDSSSRQATVLKRTVQLIRHARHFFDQGLENPGSTSSRPDDTARSIWEMVQSDVLTRHYSHASYRGLIILYLFMPTRCTSQFYMEVMPQWIESWTTLDRCHEIDFLWMCLFCRARKHVSPEEFDWEFIRKRVLTLSQYW